MGLHAPAVALAQPDGKRTAPEFLQGKWTIAYLGDGETVARRLWVEAGVRVMPGAYMARAEADGRNPGAAHIRVALVDDVATTQIALERLRPFAAPATRAA